MSEPVVSICMIAYNHELFIEQAIESIVIQHTSFDFELVISNDASSDRTHEIILRLADNMPEHITFKYFNQNENLGLIPNAVFALKQCTGKYISFCEGDDYWIDAYKLNNQILFLENNPKYNLVTGAVKKLIQNSGKFLEPTLTSDYTFSYKDMIVRNHCPTCATTFRNYIKETKDFYLFEERGIDSQIWVRALGATGKGKYFGNTVAVYRKHDDGASTILHKGTDTFEKKIAYIEQRISKAKFWNNYFGNKAWKSVNSVQIKMFRGMIKLAIEDKKYKYLPVFLLRYSKYKLISYFLFIK